MEPFRTPLEHLLAELGRLDLMLQRQVRRLRAAHLLNEDPYRGLYIPDTHVDALLSAGRVLNPRPDGTDPAVHSEAITYAIEQAHAIIRGRILASQQAGLRLPLVELAVRFGLGDFESDVLLLAAAPEIDLKYESLFAYVQNDVTRKRPTLDLALKLIGQDFESHLTQRNYFAADAPLLRHQLIALGSDAQDREPTLLSRFLKVDQRLVEYLLGGDSLDARLAPFTRLRQCSGSLDELVLPESLRARLKCAVASLRKQPAILVFQGKNGIGRESAAVAICAGLNRPLLSIDVREGLAADGPWPLLLGLIRREALLRGAAVFFRDVEVLIPDEATAAAPRAQFVRAFRACDFPVFLGTEQPFQAVACREDFSCGTFAFPPMSHSERRQLWERALNGSLNGQGEGLDLDGLANQFAFSAGQIHRTVRTARLAAEFHPGTPRLGPRDLRAAASLESSQPLRKLARRIETKYGWDDIVLPPRPLRQLRQVCLSIKHRPTVYGRWGFDRKLALGKGLVVLFEGPSGCGKSMAAQIIAGELGAPGPGLDLYQIDLSGIVSKYIGETEKNLNTIFEAAKHSNGILFFDEADALFGKRGETKDAHDRYANIEVAYLLQKMEEYDGIVILATNLGNNIDEAFHRRLHHTVEFPFPDAEYRERIWRNAFPVETPLASNIDFGFLARQFELAGGNIRNIALAGAFLAAEAASSSAAPAPGARPATVTMEHIVVATGRELQKMGRLPAKAEFQEFYELIREHG